MKILKVILIIFLIILVLAFVSFTFFSNQTVKQSEQEEFQEIYMGIIEDGIYRGAYKISPVEVKVETQVEDGQIVDIRILHHMNGLGSEAEIIVEDIIDQQKINVDNISGATVSSIAIKKAVEDSLLNN